MSIEDNIEVTWLNHSSESARYIPSMYLHIHLALSVDRGNEECEFLNDRWWRNIDFDRLRHIHLELINSESFRLQVVSELERYII